VKTTYPESDSPPYTSYLPWHSVDPEGNVILLASNADGVPDELGIAWKLGLLQAESLQDADLGALAARLDNLLLNIPDKTPVQFILRSSKNVRRILDDWRASTRTNDPILRELAESRRASLERLSVATQTSAFETRSLEALLTIVRPGTWIRTEISPLEVFRGGGEDEVSRRIASEYAADRKKMVDLARSLESLMAQSGLSARRLGEEELALELHAQLNPLRARSMGAPASLPGELLRDRVALSGLTPHLDEGLIALDDLWLKVVSVTRLPSPTRAGMLMRSVGGSTFLDTVPEMDLVLNVETCDQEEMRLKFGGNRRLAQDQSRDVHQGPSMGPHIQELSQVERDLAAGKHLVSIRIHAIVRGKSASEAADRARAIEAAFQTAGFRALTETVLAPTLFLQSLPLCYRSDNDSALRRARRTLSENLAHLLPVYGGYAGTPEPTQLLLNRRGQPVTLSFFNGKEVPHGFVTGKSGSGKSVFANDMILNALRTGGRVWVLDRGGSYRKLTEILDGSYVSYDARRPLRLNPCGRSEPDGSCPEETNSFLRDWLTEMATHGKADLAVRDQNLLSMAVRAAFRAKPGGEIFLRDIHTALGTMAAEHPAAKDLAVCIGEYVKDGPYARFFDGENQVDFEKTLVAIDLADAALEDAVTSVLVMALMYRIAQAGKAWLSQDKYLVIDEAWTLLKSPACARFIENVSRTARKFRLSLVILSQQITDLEGPSGRAILAQASYKVCLHQDPDAIKFAKDLLGLSDREAQLYGTLRTMAGVYSELFVKSPYGSGVARLAMDPLAYWVTTSDMADRTYLDGLVEKARARGSEGREALREALLEASLKHPHGAPAVRKGA
jgi:conjugal transfer ATP-binding protein TraC